MINGLLGVGFAALGMVSCGGGGSSSSPALPTALAQRFAIDGNIDFADFLVTQQQTVGYVDALGAGVAAKSATIRWGIINDDTHIYVALEWDDTTHDNGVDLVTGPTDFDGVQLVFDDDGDGSIGASDDKKIIIAASISSLYVDQFVVGTEQTDRIGDGLGRLAYDPVTDLYTAEFLIPLVADANGEDGNLTENTPYNIVLFDHVQLAATTGNVASVYASRTDSTLWPTLPLTSAVMHARPQLPTNLTGMIAFVSEHEVEPNGEIYTFDPSTGAVVRVTNLPSLFKDNPSLSHDRSMIAFHGAASKPDFASYEIYTVAVDGSNLQQLTSNVILDGHPAWSPDDSKIIFASFRDPQGESLIIMATDGTELDDLTPLGFHDNDPDYLADGRIVFKTDRFSSVPEVQIAVMNDDGSNVVQVTSLTGVSDHDPVAFGGFTVFERFPKDTDFATDIEAGFIGWPIIEASLTGGETTLLSDGWINWLPIYDPTGAYIAYQKSTGAYIEVRLMSRQGEDLCRFIPDITKIRYIDWK